MRSFIIRLVLIGFLTITFFTCTKTQVADFPVRSVPAEQVQLTDSFWSSRLETNRTITIPHVLKMCEETGRVDNFAIAAGVMQGEQRGVYPFDDSDLFKAIEAVANSLLLHPDPRLDAYVDSLITLIAGAQEADGYLYTARTNKTERLQNWFGENRWEKLRGSHELYNVGHLYEAAVAHHHATGKRNLLDVAIKSADLVCESFGPGKVELPSGHQEIEIGLAKLYRVTGNTKYLETAKFLLSARGNPLGGRELWGAYNQDHKPVLQQDEAVGHAVRAAYLYTGMAEVGALTNDPAYLRALDRIWENVVSKKLYLTGGIGSTGSGEAFSKNYELPNMSAYMETCASIANIFWNQRMFLSHGDAKYVDVLERTLYNAFLSGYGMDGNLFFYPNPLTSVGQHARTPWFSCACCPPNVARIVAALPGYFYAQQNNEVFVNLYASSTAAINLPKGSVKIEQQTQYPWDGTIKVIVEPQQNGSNFSLNLRLPGWAQNQPLPSDLYRFLNRNTEGIAISLNGKTASYKIRKGYAQIKRNWSSGDVIELTIPMPIHRIVAHDSVKADRGRVALQRGPLVYCVEWVDMTDDHVLNLLLSDDVSLETKFEPDLLRGVQVIRGAAQSYQQIQNGAMTEKQTQIFQAIPYYAWSHRGRGEMAVWLARDESAVQPLGLPSIATTSKVSASFGRNPEAVKDQLLPESSIDHEVPYYHCWPHKGTTEWIQYDFTEVMEVSMVEVYWFDDEGIGECRPPKSWRILYSEDEKWLPVYTPDPYGTLKDQFNKVIFETIRTKALRIEFQSQDSYAAGIHEWRVR